MTAPNKSLFSPKPTVRVQMVTPDLARDWLTWYNKMNRPMSERIVAKYADQMTAGKWLVNGDTITFADDVLIDGQHRLAAVAKAGVTIPMIIVNDVVRDAFATKDTGKKRNGADILGILGEQNASTVAAVLSKVVHYYAGCAHLNNAFVVDYQEAINLYPEVRDICKHYQLRSLCSAASSILAAYVICSRVNKAQADEFFARVADGIGLGVDSQERLLREQLLRIQDSGTKTRIAAMAWTIKAWNAKRQGRKLKLIQWHRGKEQKEEFPIAI